MHFRIIALAALLITTIPGHAQQLDEATIRLMRQDLRAEQKKIIAANMPLTETEGARFWPVYDRYIAESVKVNDARYALIKEYAQVHETLTEEHADSFVKRWISLDAEAAKLRLKFIPEFEKVISHKKTALFFQLDRRLAMMIEVQFSLGTPLIEP